jgi:hypothetical protein
MIEGEFWNFLISSVQKVVDSEFVCLIDALWPLNRLDHRPNDDVRIDDGEVEYWFVVFKELPGSLLGQLLGRVVP